MSPPKLTIIGVYRTNVSAETWQEQWRVTADDDATKEHFRRLVLIEAIVEGLEEPFSMGNFGQMQVAFRNYPSHMQVGYDEGLLSFDGENLIQPAMNCVQGSGPLRFACYLHLYDPELPLLWQNGEVACPPVGDMPVRLSLLMPYKACS